jgi:hypothetical protein
MTIVTREKPVKRSLFEALLVPSRRFLDVVPSLS